MNEQMLFGIEAIPVPTECDEDVTSDIPMIGFFPHCKPLWDFCPYCGADMRGEQND